MDYQLLLAAELRSSAISHTLDFFIEAQLIELEQLQDILILLSLRLASDLRLCEKLFLHSVKNDDPDRAEGCSPDSFVFVDDVFGENAKVHRHISEDLGGHVVVASAVRAGEVEHNLTCGLNVRDNALV